MADSGKSLLYLNGFGRIAFPSRRRSRRLSTGRRQTKIVVTHTNPPPRKNKNVLEDAMSERWPPAPAFYLLAFGVLLTLIELYFAQCS
jgi:hypothetical protein